MHRIFWGAALLAVFLPVRVAAQAVSGTILGAVKDPSGAVVANAQVSITNANTGLIRNVTSDNAGNYLCPLLPPGIYAVSAEAPGFKRVTLTNIELQIDQKARVDVMLEVGAVSETVNVQSATPLVSTDTSELGAVVNEKQILQLPLNGRDFVHLTRVIPGVLRGIPGANIDGAGSLAWRMSASFSANGNRTRDNNFLLDGVDNNETWLNSVVVFPSVDALQEFKVQTSTYSAEFGRSSGGVVNIHIKSGTNDLHGSAFEFLRNDKLDANDLFNNKNGRAKPPFRQNQFGATLGGPIRKDRTFFFMDYQGWRRREAQTYLSNVPSLAMRRGDFSELNRPLYDPLNPGQPFANNLIPPNRVDPAARNIIDQLYPEPNVTGQRGSTGQIINNFLYNPVLTRQDDQFDVKIDQRISDHNQFFGRYSFERTDRFLPASLPHGDAGFTFGAGTGLIRSQSLALNDTHTFSPAWVNEFRFGFSRIAIKVTSIDNGLNLAQKVGIPGINISDISTMMSQITFNPAQEIRHLGANSNQPLLTFLDTFQWYDNVTHAAGKHTLRMGFNVTRRRRNILNIDNPVGNFQFSNNLTSNCAGIASGCTINPGSGFSFASFMLGYPISEVRGLMLGIYGERRPEYAWYFQDDIKLTSRLTVNLGIRWDLFVPFVEHHDRQSNFDASTGRFVVASENAAIGGVKYGRALQVTPYKDFAPRVGFAYNALGSGRLVLRGGYGIFWNSPLTGTSSSKAQNPPFLLSQSFTTTFSPARRLSEGLPPPPPLDFNAPPSGTTRSLFDPNFRDGYVQQWNFNIQQQLTRDTMLQLAYAGSHGTHLMMKQDVNQAPPRVGVTNQDVNRPYIGVSPLLRSLSQVKSTGWSTHNSLQARLDKRFSRGLTGMASYTFGKTLDIVSDTEGATLNAYNFNYDRGLAQFDVAHTLTLSWLYELPWGRGKRFGGNIPAALDKIAGGWEVNGITLVRTGLPINITQQQIVASTGTGNRPDRIGKGTLDNPTPDRWFDVSAFLPTRDNTGTYGSAGRDILRAPGQLQFDLSLVKRTRFLERFEHQIKAEFFNAFNHPQFGAPGTTIGTANAGVISSLLFNTPMRQIQLAMKLSF
jgi:hypothetical protein